MAEREIDWASAEVKGATLTVAISGGGDAAKQWLARVQSVLRVLDRSGGRWGEIKVSKDKFQVSELREGAEPDLRHLLESAVLQANADLARGENSDEQREAEDSDDQGSSADQQMTDAFRSFAPAGDGDADDQHDDAREKDGRSKRDAARR